MPDGNDGEKLVNFSRHDLEAAQPLTKKNKFLIGNFKPVFSTFWSFHKAICKIIDSRFYMVGVFVVICLSVCKRERRTHDFFPTTNKI